MKKFLFFIFIVFTAIEIPAQSWRQATNASGGSFYDVFFINENIGWMVGSKGEILKSTDGGVNWDSPVSQAPVSTTLNSVYFLDENHGFAGGYNNILLKTTDGGSTWAKDTVETSKSSIYNIYFSDSQNGWLLISSYSMGQVVHTTDGGITWTVDFVDSTGSLDAMNFYSPTNGICVGGGAGRLDLYYTKDGKTWQKATTPPTLPVGYTRTDARCVYMTSADTAYVSGWGSNYGAQPSIQLKTVDGGVTWTYLAQSDENKTYVNLFSNTFKNNLVGLAAGGGPIAGTVVVKTTDGGTTWKEINVPFGFEVKSIYSIGNNVWIAGYSGGFAYSRDFGNTWEMAHEEIPSASLYTFHWFTKNFAVAGGYSGLLLYTTNGGVDWTAKYASTDNRCPSINDISFVNENVGYLARSNRMVTKTTDGGNTWSVVIPDTTSYSYNNYGVYFVNADTGFVVGKAGTRVSAFYKTTNGGKTWEKQIGNFADQINGVYFSDAQKGVVVGNKLIVQYTTDGGTSWSASTVNNVPSDKTSSNLNKLNFLDSNNGLACGYILLKTTDGGVTWDYVAVPGQPKIFKSCYMESLDHWYAVGSKTVFETTDAGSTWTNIADLNVIKSSSIYGVTCDLAGNVWISGSNSQIYTTAPVTSVSDKNIVNPNKFVLKQNYPNPFNPTTKIRFVLPFNAQVNISVYNILGEFIKNITNANYNAGIYTVNFNASGLTSGIYFYKINVKSVNGLTYTNVKKMILLK